MINYLMPSKPKITASELPRAILIDYEGNIDRAPTLLGWRIDGQTTAAIIEDAFATCSDRYRAKGIFQHQHKKLAVDLIEQACDEDRVVISWSEHYLRVMSQILSPKNQSRLMHRYRNAIATARPWHYELEQARAPTGELAYFNKLLGFPIPDKYGTGKVGQGLRLIRNQLNEGRDCAELTPKARASWIAIVKHNALDLRSMEYVLRAMFQLPPQESTSGQLALTLIQESMDTD